MNATAANVEIRPDLDQVILARVQPGFHPRSTLAKLLAGVIEISPSVFHRWTSRGTRGVVLESWFVGGRRMTTRESLAAFFRELNAPAESSAPIGRSPARGAGTTSRPRPS